MAKRVSGARASAAKKTAAEVRAGAPAASTAGNVEARLVAFAEQLGELAGHLEARAAHALDGDALAARLAAVREQAVHLLEHLTPARRSKAVPDVPRPAQPTPGSGARAGGRSGGIVDAPGKSHRKAPARDPQRSVARSQAAKLRDAMPMAKTPRRRGRG